MDTTQHDFWSDIALEPAASDSDVNNLPDLCSWCALVGWHDGVWVVCWPSSGRGASISIYLYIHMHIRRAGLFQMFYPQPRRWYDSNLHSRWSGSYWYLSRQCYQSHWRLIHSVLESDLCTFVKTIFQRQLASSLSDSACREHVNIWTHLPPSLSLSLSLYIFPFSIIEAHKM